MTHLWVVEILTAAEGWAPWQPEGDEPYVFFDEALARKWMEPLDETNYRLRTYAAVGDA